MAAPVYGATVAEPVALEEVVAEPDGAAVPVAPTAAEVPLPDDGYGATTTEELLAATGATELETAAELE